MKILFAALAMTVLIGNVSARAQTEADHRVQRAWDDVFNPPPPGDPRTNFERHRDNAHYREARAAEHARWCRSNPRAESCARY